MQRIYCELRLFAIVAAVLMAYLVGQYLVSPACAAWTKYRIHRIEQARAAGLFDDSSSGGNLDR